MQQQQQPFATGCAVSSKLRAHAVCSNRCAVPMPSMQVRHIEVTSVNRQLESGYMVLLSNLGYSAAGAQSLQCLIHRSSNAHSRLVLQHMFAVQKLSRRHGVRQKGGLSESSAAARLLPCRRPLPLRPGGTCPCCQQSIVMWVWQAGC